MYPEISGLKRLLCVSSVVFMSTCRQKFSQAMCHVSNEPYFPSDCISPTSQPNRTWGMDSVLNASALCRSNVPSTTSVTFYTCPFLPRTCPRHSTESWETDRFPALPSTRPAPADLPACPTGCTLAGTHTKATTVPPMLSSWITGVRTQEVKNKHEYKIWHKNGFQRAQQEMLGFADVTARALSPSPVEDTYTSPVWDPLEKPQARSSVASFPEAPLPPCRPRPASLPSVSSDISPCLPSSGISSRPDGEASARRAPWAPLHAPLQPLRLGQFTLDDNFGPSFKSPF